MTTEEIDRQLQAYGVLHSRELFLALAEDTDSAWTLSEAWLEQESVTQRKSPPSHRGR